jgi:hypothetical protein
MVKDNKNVILGLDVGTSKMIRQNAEKLPRAWTAAPVKTPIRRPWPIQRVLEEPVMPTRITGIRGSRQPSQPQLERDGGDQKKEVTQADIDRVIKPPNHRDPQRSAGAHCRRNHRRRTGVRRWE